MGVPPSGSGLRPFGAEPPEASQAKPLVPNAEEVWTGSKGQREALRERFGGRCAYCGSVLDKMHADHVEPCVRITRDAWGQPLSDPYMLKPERNTVANMMPACAPCNLHKGGHSLKGWRDLLERSAAILRRDTSTFRAGERFGIIAVNEKPIIFYFERLASGTEARQRPDPAEGLDPEGDGAVGEAETPK